MRAAPLAASLASSKPRSPDELNPHPRRRARLAGPASSNPPQSARPTDDGGPDGAPPHIRGLDGLVAEVRELYARALRMKLHWSLHEPAVREAARAVADLGELCDAVDHGVAGCAPAGAHRRERALVAPWERSAMAADIQMVRPADTRTRERSARDHRFCPVVMRDETFEA